MTTAQELSEKTNRARTIISASCLKKQLELIFFSKFLLLLSLAMLNIVNTDSWDLLYCAGRAVPTPSRSRGVLVRWPIKHGGL